ncbi:hypothetical protein BDV96DRAFT_587839 [Lophiotrema nucula]|uniref:Uncharacterized protein n=1 Tax=Lophiotrema nucula TaxID=690887 RepID=A0A6A5YM20_9PLEO|nr:hypothetical protein BDV96DRAFT_587839 [Lophiotrema nucula]
MPRVASIASVAVTYENAYELFGIKRDDATNKMKCLGTDLMGADCNASIYNSTSLQWHLQRLSERGSRVLRRADLEEVAFFTICQRCSLPSARARNKRVARNSMYQSYLLHSPDILLAKLYRSYGLDVLIKSNKPAPLFFDYNKGDDQPEDLTVELAIVDPKMERWKEEAQRCFWDSTDQKCHSQSVSKNGRGDMTRLYLRKGGFQPNSAPSSRPTNSMPQLCPLNELGTTLESSKAMSLERTPCELQTCPADRSQSTEKGDDCSAENEEAQLQKRIAELSAENERLRLREASLKSSSEELQARIEKLDPWKGWEIKDCEGPRMMVTEREGRLRSRLNPVGPSRRLREQG